MAYPPVPPGSYPQQVAYPQQGGHPPDNYLVWGILTLLFCCPPLGIVSVVKSTQVSSLWAQGRQAEAYQAAAAAKKFAIMAAIVGPAIALVMIIGYFVIMVVLIATMPPFE